MKNIFITILFTLTIVSGFAQTVTFQKKITTAGSEYAYNAVDTKDNAYILCGASTVIPGGLSDFYVVKLNSNGDTIWTRIIGNSLIEQSRGITSCFDSSVVILGSSQSNYVLIKLNLKGDTIWTKNLGYASPVEPSCIIQNRDSSFLISGNIYSHGGDLLFTKTDGNGNVLWSLSYGGDSAESVNEVIETYDHGYVAAGTIRYFGSGVADYFILKTDSSGNVLWTRVIEMNGIDYALSVVENEDSSLLINGFSNYLTLTHEDPYVICLSSSGSLLWSKIYDLPSRNQFYDIIKTYDNGFVMTGSSGGCGPHFGSLLMKIDNQGNPLWNYAYSGGYFDVAYRAIECQDKGFFITGTSTLSATSGDYDFFYIKTDSLGRTSCHDTIPACTVVVPVLTVNLFNSDTASFNVTINAANLNFSNGGFPSTVCFSTGIQEDSHHFENNMRIFPNPAHQSIHVSCFGFNTIDENPIDQVINKIEVVNLFGEIMLSDNPNKVNPDLEIHLPGGMYLVKVYTSRYLLTQKLMIQ